MSRSHLLKLKPFFVQRPWGGRELSRWYPDLPPGLIGEAWVLSTRKEAPSTVMNGPLAGTSMAAYELPVLVKLIHAAQNLSIQVHPPDTYAGLPQGESGKSELWMVLAARPDAAIFHGLLPGVSDVDLARAAASGALVECLRRVPVTVGDVVSIPPGTIHALGAGTIVAEVQQNSDTTYRLWDYNRPGLDGKLRSLHIADGLAVSSTGQPPDVIRPVAGTLDCPTPLGELPKSIRVGYACIGDGDYVCSPDLTALLVLEGQVEGVLPGHCLIVQAQGTDCSGLRSSGGATAITLHHSEP
jgi:mannose-6-phosphate isomerase